MATAAGAIPVRAPRVGDRRSDPMTGERARFRSVVLPPWCRRSPKVGEVLPLLYLHGLSTGDFVPALEAFFGLALTLSCRQARTWGREPMTALSFEAVSTVDYHTGGEPFRIVAVPPVDLLGATVTERRVRAIQDPQADELRRLLCWEPRGHADMYGGFITPPDDPGADLGVLFWHKDGFSTACGHGTIALGAWAVETGRVQAAADGATEVRIDVPSGRVVVRVHTEAGRVTAVDFVNVASYLLAQDVEVATSRGTVRVDIGFGGAIHAQLQADRVGLAVAPEQVNELLAIGREVKWPLNDSAHAQHPSDDRPSGIYGTIVFDELGTTEDGSLHQRNVTIFADGEVDRSPCGSGSAARLAVLDARGDLGPGQALVHDSIVGSTFRCRVVDSLTAEATRP